MPSLDGECTCFHDLQNAKVGQQVGQRLGLALFAEDGDGQSLVADVDDVGAEDIGHLNDLVPHVALLRLHLDEGELPLDGRLLVQNLHRHHGDQLAALGGDLVDHQLVGQNDDGDEKKEQKDGKNDEDDNKQDEPQDKPQDKDDQNKDQQKQQSQGEPPKITPQAAQQMLQAIQAKEKETQDKVNKEKAEALKGRQKDKNW